MIDGQELLASLAHQPLGGKEIFGSSFVRNEPIAGYVVELISGADQRIRATEQAAAFLRTGGPGVSKNPINLVTG